MNKPNIPTHIAIIMDGNRRWAKAHKLPILMGHEKAAKDTIEPLADRAIELGIKYLTFWAFSTENWQRDKTEVTGLLQILREVLKDNIGRLHKKGIKIQTIGDLSKFPKDIQQKLKNGTAKTKNNKKLTLTLALNYGGRNEIIRAIKKIPPKKISTITEEEFNTYLDTRNLPDPDLIIRTAGELRLSGFLPWQTEYTELYFTNTLWPDFSPKDLDLAVEEYKSRQRRFGK